MYRNALAGLTWTDCLRICGDPARLRAASSRPIKGVLSDNAIGSEHPAAPPAGGYRTAKSDA
jgi:hypothetical protein